MVTDTTIKKGLPDETSVKAGYKQTEIGVIPEDWDIVKLNLLSNDIGDGIHTTPKYVDSSNYFFVNGNNLSDGRILITRNTKCISENEYESLKKNLDNTTILMSINGTIGNLAFFNDETVVLGKSAAYIKLSQRTDKIFIYYLLQHSSIKKFYDNELTGTTIKNLSLASIRATPIPIPPTKTEQIAIATVLSDADALIENLGKLIAKKKAIKQGAMQQLLTGKKRLPGFSGEWVVSPLGKLCNYQNGTALEKYFNNRNGLLVISIGNYSEAGKFVETSSYIDRKYFKELKKFVLNKNDLTMILNDKTAVGTIIGRVLYIDENEKYIFNQRTMRLTAKDEIEPLFLYFQINSSKTHKYIVNLSKPGTQIYVNTNDITELPIAFPKSKPEQTAIATILSDMDAEIESLEQKRDKYTMLKQGMMQQLLTGRIRIYANN